MICNDNKKKRIIVLFATHKKYRMPSDELYLPVHVGAAGKESIGYQRDDEGENISSFNPFFCELTGMYWAWKNLDADYIGLVHYRRLFRSGHYSRDIWKSVLKKEDIEQDLGKIKVFIPPKRRYWIESLYSHYKHTHHIFHLDTARSVIGELYPDYLDSFDKVCRRSWGYMFNMMIMERGLFNDYCSWLFNVLFETEKRLGNGDHPSFQNRCFGRISEIIFNVWLDQKIKEGLLSKDEIREIPLIYTEKVDWWKKGSAFLKAKFFNVKYIDSY